MTLKELMEELILMSASAKLDRKSYRALMQTIRILRKLEKCNDTSATRCFTCIGQIKESD